MIIIDLFVDNLSLSLVETSSKFDKDKKNQSLTFNRKTSENLIEFLAGFFPSLSLARAMLSMRTPMTILLDLAKSRSGCSKILFR